MRQIKFRAWDTMKGKMTVNLPRSCFYGDGGGSYFGEPCMLIDGADGRYEVMQFTGLLDKNGKEIYEGDILKWGEKDIIVVEWQNIEWCFRERDGLSYLSSFYGFGERYLEIIGNIYENPELLK